ncbi:MAG TPA: hypothetical protein PLI24_05655 [Candidatus Cloacimonas sp.]|jgi:hypothetical protein|nr:hypothetical protein [Candidatus Cloacimonas sp.]MDD2250807.1 hypothetical protein [Candidatus Cloacimonadota bacterium]HPN26756.1 hypothetical protein [Candidatus Cloacimonas sp.]HPZ02186.1 hypothetical protein [Candidatus Cloacimonas sp.]HQB50141.1 hypothetical protein [Candidatus Cloacimonas sp.]
MKKAVIIICGAILCISLQAGNSIFSFYGFPVHNYGRDIYSLGMGDTGASDVFRINTGYANPAMHNRNNYTLFSTGMNMGYTKYHSQYEGIKRTFRDDSLDFPYFNINIPIGRNRLGVQFNSLASGLVTNYHYLPDGSVESQTSDKYLYKADLIYSYSFSEVNLGISANYYFGHNKQYFSQTGNYSNFDTRESIIMDFKNPSITVGTIKLFDKYSVGAHYCAPVTLKGELIRSSIHNTEPAEDYKFKLPEQYCLSATALPFEQFKVAADINYEPWSTISDDYRDCYKIGLGLAYEPNMEAHKNIFMRFPMRVGASMRQLYFRDKDGKDIDEVSLSCGLTLPLKNEIDRIDLGFQYLKRGDLATNNLSENSYMLMIGFTGFDIISKAPDRTAPRNIPVKEEVE